ncbi:hypothetical protein DL771_005814 [Monosporascus sp. 5C6A]|nr:hypothetical protein DL771_005814 [Monosporascus sp. 5C6A]
MLEKLCPSLLLNPVTPPQYKKDVLLQLRTCQIFHFAGHGHSNPLEPSQSYLLLKDWKNDPLTVADLRDHSFQENSPFLGYLSACSTGANDAEGFIDEAIHLVSAFQLAGFRHVVGTLWEIFDSQCVDVARLLYETIRDEGMTDEAICRGLHRALRALRDGDIRKSQAIGGNSVVGIASTNAILEAAKTTDGMVRATQDSRQSQSVEKHSVPETMKRDCNVPMALQLEVQLGFEKEVAGMYCKDEEAGANDGNKAMALTRGGDDTPRDERNVVLLGRKRDTKEQSSELSWVPYIHFGV